MQRAALPPAAAGGVSTETIHELTAAAVRVVVESIHVVDKIGHECQNLAIEHGFLAIKQWPANRR